jgi:hypothetical protein
MLLHQNSCSATPTTVTSRRRSAFDFLRLEQRESARRIRIDGVEWLVYEWREQELDRRSGTSLVFESETTVRRVREYPESWRTLTDEQLAALSWSK